MGKRRCKGKTKVGKPCHAYALKAGAYCMAHVDRETQEKAGFGGAQPGAGRPRLPKPHEAMRDRVEGELEKWLKPYEEALGALEGKVPDHRARMQASREVLDRVYGKPAQAVELTGAGGGAVAVDVMAVDDFDAETRKLAHDLLARAADAAAD